MKTGDFLNKLATLSGLESDNEALKSLLSNSALSEIDVPDAVASHITSNLMTMESAKNNADLQKHFKAITLNGLDSKIENIINTSKLDDETVSAIKDMKNSFEKVEALTKAIQDNNKGDGGSKDAKIVELNEQLSALQNELQTRESEFQSKLQSQQINFAQNGLLNGIQYGDNLPKSDYISLMQQKIDQHLTQNNVVRTLDESGNIVLKQKTDDGELMDYFVDNQKIGFSDIAEKIAAENKYIKVSSGTPPPGTPPATPPSTPSGGGGDKPASKFAAAVDSLE